MSPVAERIGEFLARTGAMTPHQVRQVLGAQKSGVARRFGEIALALGFVRDNSIKRYLDCLEKQAGRS
jgi:hypothetical protein